MRFEFPILLGIWSKFARVCWSDPDIPTVYSLVAFMAFALVDLNFGIASHSHVEGRKALTCVLSGVGNCAMTMSNAGYEIATKMKHERQTMVGEVRRWARCVLSE